MASLKKIPVSELKVGMYLYALSGSWIENPFWRSKFVIEDQEDILQIRKSSVSDAWIDIEKSRQCSPCEEHIDEEADAQVEAPAIQKTIPKPTSISDEIERAKKICSSANKAVKSMFEEARMGKAISIQVANEVVEDISMSVMRNPGALISTARLKTVDDYTYMHSVAVCALMIALARQLNLDDDDTREAGLAGLLHDLGKIETPPDILNKTGRLTDAEFEIIKKHPQQGHQLLMEGGKVCAAALDVCLHHHERVDGTGYPFGMAGDQISLFAKMGAVCDVYDAITSNRPYKKGWCPAESIKMMASWSGNHFDKKVFEAFVCSVGIYPIGSFVKLTSGKLGTVVEQSGKSLVAPKVKVFFSTKSGVYITPEIIDLSLIQAGGRSEKIVGYEDAAKWNIKNCDQMWAN